jgi:hypothetical protein
VVVSSISFILCGCLNPDITADKVSLNDGDDDDGERSIDIYVVCVK